VSGIVETVGSTRATSMSWFTFAPTTTQKSQVSPLVDEKDHDSVRGCWGH
jgi:hypothetical protein